MSATLGVLRLGRSVVLALACLLLSLTAHVVAGGAPPSAADLALLVVPLVCGCVWLTSRRVGPVRLGAALLATQLGLHEAFMALADPSCAAPHAGHDPMAGVDPCATAAAMGAPSTAMVVAHVVTAVVMGAALLYGERLLWALLSWLSVARLQTRSLALLAVRPPSADLAVACVSARVLGGVGRRGPPVWVSA